MSFDVLGDLNWLAVLVATVAYYILGAIWYAPQLFGRAWRQSDGWEPPAGQGTAPRFYIIPLLTCFLATVATAMVAVSTGAATFGDGLVLGLVVGVGYGVAVVAVLSLTRALAGTWLLVNGGYHLVGLLIASVIVTVWD
jgi:Protein of unknown function (DUF1761)